MSTRLTTDELYYASLVVRASNGDNDARRILWTDEYVPAEIREWFTLYMDLNIRADSPESARLDELTNKYECDHVFSYMAAS